MNKFIIGVLAMVFTAFTSAQTMDWTLVPVNGANKGKVGYIYHTYSRGTAINGNSKLSVAAGLRFICSTVGNPHPIVGVFWNGSLMNSTSTQITITVDGSRTFTETWIRDYSLLYSPAARETELLNAMKRGRSVKFVWYGNGTKYSAGFNLNDFNLTEFNTACKTAL